jgi:hypothetical protein
MADSSFTILSRIKPQLKMGTEFDEEINRETWDRISETSPLLPMDAPDIIAPSANSTDLPTVARPTTITYQQGDQWHLDCDPRSTPEMRSDLAADNLRSNDRMSSKKIIGSIILVLVSLSVSVFMYSWTRNGTHSNGMSSVNYMNVDQELDYLAPTGWDVDDVHPKSYSTPRYHGLWSTLHPVHDLGLFGFKRTSSTMPSKALRDAVLFYQPNSKHRKHRHDSNNDNIRHLKSVPSRHRISAPSPSSNQSDKSMKTPKMNGLGGPPYQTNAWYQNMLMLDDDTEPQPVHRAYSSPYVVDAAGPIPGLRLMANHIEASTAVVQLFVNENYGLTVGASPKLYSSRNDNATMPDATDTSRYFITHTSELSLTLGWVCLCVFVDFQLFSVPRCIF